MRVALLSRAVFPVHGYGGLERHVAALEKYLKLAGCEVTLFTSPAEGGARLEPREGTEFVPYRTIPWPRRKGFVVLDRDTNYLAWSVGAARRVLARGGVDIVQADGGAGFGYGLLAGPETPPFVLHPHGMEEFKAPAAKRALYLPLRSATRFAARRAARVLAPDASMKEEVKQNLGVEEERMSVVPNAIDLSEIDRRTPAVSLEIPPGARVLLSVGRLEPNKGFSYLVRALSRARARLPKDFLWILVGEGPERAKLETEIAREGLDAQARLTGRIGDDELHPLYERCEIFVHPTLYEGSSMVTLEAMAHRKPIVATRAGGIPDKILHRENGLLVPPADVDALEEAIVEALAAGDRLKDWGERSRVRVERHFSWSERVKELVALYEEVLRSRHRRIRG
ncbi:MAG: glycosyltransferase family 4 protein [Vicinamibacteria bacterium]